MKLLNSYEAMQPEGQFYLAFLEAMLWIEFDNSCNPLEHNYSLEDIDQDSADTLKTLCTEFIESVGNDIILEHNYSQAGHDFYLSIAGHGCGFWDGDWPINEKKLKDICACVNVLEPYIGDDEKIYVNVSIIDKSKSFNAIEKEYQKSIKDS